MIYIILSNYQKLQSHKKDNQEKHLNTPSIICQCVKDKKK